jgi:K+-sensing histidine kinase KdpD
LLHHISCYEKAKLFIVVFINSIKNAIECYDGEGGKIDFKIIRDANGINFSVKDYGKGIPEEIQEKIFKNMVSIKGINRRNRKNFCKKVVRLLAE